MSRSFVAVSFAPLHLLLLALAALAVGTSCASRDASGHTPPNIVFIMVDDLGWMDLGVQGNADFHTPNIDRLAREGMRFTDFYAAAPVCSPTRAACITGLAPARTHITNHIPDRWRFYDAPPQKGAKKAAPRRGRPWGPGKSRNTLDPRHTSVAQRLKAAGYRTGFVGKWHLAGADWKTTDRRLFPESYGFDVNVAGNAMGGPGTFYAPIRLPNYEAGEEGEYLTDLLADEAIDFATAPAQEPFFLCFWPYAVHWPIEAPRAMYSRADVRASTDAGAEPDLPTRYRLMVEAMDRAIGRFLEALEAQGLASNTLLVFTSDNGQMPGASEAKPLRAAKGHLYEGGIRVPMIVRWPGRISPGRVSSAPAISMDFVPTFLDAAGLVYDPADFDGVSLLAHASASRAPLPRDAIYLHFPHYAYHGRNSMASVVRRGRYKYIHHYDDDAHELYDLEADLGERVNLASREAPRVAEMRAMLERWLRDTSAARPRPYHSIPAGELPGKKRAATDGSPRVAARV